MCRVCGCYRVGIVVMDCDDICMCVVNKQFELIEFFFKFRLC